MKIIIEANTYIILTSTGRYRNPHLNLEIIGNDEVVYSIILGEYYERNHDFHGNYNVRLKHRFIPFRKKRVYLDKDKDYEIVLKFRKIFFLASTLLLIILIFFTTLFIYLNINNMLTHVTIIFTLIVGLYYLSQITKLIDYEFIEYVQDEDMTGKIPIEFDSTYRGYTNRNIYNLSGQLHLYIDDKHICEMGDGRVHKIMVNPMSKVEMKINGRTYESVDFWFIEGERYVVESAYSSKVEKLCLLLFLPCTIIPIVILSYLGLIDKIYMMTGFLIGILIWVAVIVLISNKNRKFSVLKYNG